MTNEKDIYVTNVEQAITVTIRSYVDLSITSDHGKFAKSVFIRRHGNQSIGGIYKTKECVHSA